MKRAVSVSLGLAGLLALGAGGFALWSSNQPYPSATLAGAPVSLGVKPVSLDLVVSAPSGNVKSLSVTLVQGGKETSILSESPMAETSPEVHRTITLDAKALALAEGAAELRVMASDDRWRPSQDNSVRLVQSFDVDLTAPSLEFRAATKYIKHAGSGIAAWRAKGASRSFVRCGEREFAGTSGLSSDADVYVALFTLPYDSPPGDPVVHAEDEAGNSRTMSIPIQLLGSNATRDVVNLNDDFMRRKVGELNPRSTATDGAELLTAFLEINQGLRKENEAKNREIGGSVSEPLPLFSGAFRQQPNSKVFASFPQERDYKLATKVVDTQWHLGLDLASNAASPVLASGGGKVIFAGENGIYGNMVVLDHGLGLTSLYAHLSEMGVSVGQSVAQGESLGRSGMTGLAAGDHLHFAMLIHGTYTNPIDWFDAKYISDRIAGPLVEAGLSLPGLTDIVIPTRAETKQAKRAAKETRRTRR